MTGITHVWPGKFPHFKGLARGGMGGQGWTCVGVGGRVWMQWCVLNKCVGSQLSVVLEQATIAHVYVCMKI